MRARDQAEKITARAIVALARILQGITRAIRRIWRD